MLLRLTVTGDRVAADPQMTDLWEALMDTITVTPGALESIKELRAEYGEDGWGLRYGITGGGCSGYKYVLEFEPEPESDDLVFDQGSGVKVFVKQDHMEKLKNSSGGAGVTIIQPLLDNQVSRFLMSANFDK